MWYFDLRSRMCLLSGWTLENGVWSVLLWAAALCLIAVLLYLTAIAPRMIHKPDRSAFVNVHYAHRGLHNNASEAPENSLAAFRKAVEAGYGIELDVQLSKDNIPVVFHDASLKRICGIDGKVWEYSLAELRKMRLCDSGETIPTFEEVLALVNGRVPLIVEYKLDRVQTKVCELGNQLLSEYAGPYCIECFHPLAVLWYRKNRPDVMRGQLSRRYQKDERFKGKFIYFLMTYLVPNIATRPDFIAFDCQDVPIFCLKLCRRMGALGVAWTVKSREEYEAVKKEFDMFIFEGFRL